MKIFFIILVSIFSLVFVGPEIFDMWGDYQKGESIESGSVIFLIFAFIFLFFVFKKILSIKQGGVIQNSLSKDKVKKLISFGNKVEARIISLDTDVIETADSRAVYLVLQEVRGLRKYKTLVFKNHEDLLSELKAIDFKIYVDPENPHIYFIGLQEVLDKKGNIFFIPM